MLHNIMRLDLQLIPFTSIQRITTGRYILEHWTMLLKLDHKNVTNLGTLSIHMYIEQPTVRTCTKGNLNTQWWVYKFYDNDLAREQLVSSVASCTATVMKNDKLDVDSIHKIIKSLKNCILFREDNIFPCLHSYEISTCNVSYKCNIWTFSFCLALNQDLSLFNNKPVTLE